MTTFNPTKEQLQELINKNYSSYDIAEHFNKSQTSIRFWLKKYNLTTNFKFRQAGAAINKNCILFKDRNWPNIQNYYNDNHSWTDVQKEFKISQNTINQAIKLNLLISRPITATHKLKNKGTKHTEQTKKQLSLKRKEYLLNNPDKPAWKQSNKKFSVPCEQLKQKLIDLNIKFTEEFQPLLHLKRFFSIDIAFPEHKIGIEINGRQHYDANGNLLPYYQERHNLIQNDGWQLYEIPYQKAFDINFILSILEKHKLVVPPGFAPR